MWRGSVPYASYGTVDDIPSGPDYEGCRCTPPPADMSASHASATPEATPLSVFAAHRVNPPR